MLKKLVALFLVVTLLTFTSAVVFAGDDTDPQPIIIATQTK